MMKRLTTLAMIFFTCLTGLSAQDFRIETDSIELKNDTLLGIYYHSRIVNENVSNTFFVTENQVLSDIKLSQEMYKILEANYETNKAILFDTTQTDFRRKAAQLSNSLIRGSLVDITKSFERNKLLLKEIRKFKR